MLGEGMMTYENSIVQAVKHADNKYREQSFDQIKRKRRSVNSGAHVRSKQLSSNSGRRAAIAASNNKSSSQQPSGHMPIANSRSNSSKRGKHQNPQQFRGESSRGVLSSAQPTSSHSNTSSH